MGKDRALTIAGTDYLTEIPSCNKNCPIYDKCNYDRRARLCGYRYEYFKIICDNLRHIFEEPDPLVAHHINFILMPLYQHLISIRLELKSFDGILMRNKMGNYSHAYKELRDTTKQIMNTLKEMGIKNVGDLEGPEKKDTKSGDSNYYNKLVKRSKR